jgi:hypothetical protein
VTSGDDLESIGKFLQGRTRYNAAEVVEYLLGTEDARLHPAEASGLA